jgi:hypothetical protein
MDTGVLSDTMTPTRRLEIGTQWAFDRIPPNRYLDKLTVMYHVCAFMRGERHSETDTILLQSLSDYLQGSFYHDEEGSFRVASEPLEMGTKAPTIFSAFHPGNQKIYYYRYLHAYEAVHGAGPACLQQLNAFDLQRLPKNNETFRSHIDGTWGFVLYSTQGRHVKSPYHGFVCLMTMDNKGRGRILMDKDIKNDLLSDIKAQCPDIWGDAEKQRIIKEYGKRKELAWLLELYVRSVGAIYPHELCWFR